MQLCSRLPGIHCDCRRGSKHQDVNRRLSFSRVLCLLLLRCGPCSDSAVWVSERELRDKEHYSVCEQLVSVGSVDSTDAKSKLARDFAPQTRLGREKLRVVSQGFFVTGPCAVTRAIIFASPIRTGDNDGERSGPRTSPPLSRNDHIAVLTVSRTSARHTTHAHRAVCVRPWQALLQPQDLKQELIMPQKAQR